MTPTLYAMGDALSLRAVKTERFKVGYLSVSAVLPIQRERVYKTTLLLSVLRRGTEQYPTLAAINRRLDYLYGTEIGMRNFYRGDAQIIGFCAELLDPSYLPAGEDVTRGALELITQLLFHPLLDERGLLNAAYVEHEKRVQCDMIRSLKNNPRAYASERLRELLLEGEPCVAPPYGTEEEVMAITPEELTAHWRELVASLSLECIYIGREDPQRLCALLRETLGAELGERSVTPYRAPVRAVPNRNRLQPLTVEEEMAVTQCHLVMGFCTDCTLNDPTHRACLLFNEMLGASPISKLFVNVRERLSLCYSCGSSYQPYKGTLTVYCGLGDENREVATREILRQIKAIAKGEFTDGELEAAKRSLINAYRQVEDISAALENFYLGQLLNGSHRTLEACRHEIGILTREDVIAVAKRVRLDCVYYLQGTLEDEGAEAEDEND